MSKERVTITLDAELLQRIDRLAEIHETSRSGKIERMLEAAVDEAEAFLKDVDKPIIGTIVQGIMDHPSILKAVAKLVGEQLKAEDIERIDTAGARLRRARVRLENERGKRNDLKK